MTSKLNNIDELFCLKLTGLREVCKHNRLFSGYGIAPTETILKNIDEMLKNNISVFVPDIHIKHYKCKYIGNYKNVDGFFVNDCVCNNSEIKKVLKKDDPEYPEKRKKHLIDITKNRYKTDENFRNKMRETSKKYYDDLKSAKKIFEENKKNDIKI